ncbi:Bcnmd3 [Apiospora arundinis]|uniref:Uncharacterized protein n=1 Tax=Apiospora arundinis TaxID=335852 RepID=A0ABR2IUX1_9PEZI
MPRSVVGSQDQSAVEEDEVLSTNATVGTQSRSGTPRADREPQERLQGPQGRQQSLTRALARNAQLQQPGLDDQQPASTTDDVLKWDNSQFRGLTPPPLPYEARPQIKKRGLQEIMEDNSPQEPDRMIREIDELLKPTLQHRHRQAGSSSGMDNEQRRDDNDQSAEKSLVSDHAAKRIKASSSKGDDDNGLS